LALLLALTLWATAYAQEDESGSDDGVTDVLSEDGEATVGDPIWELDLTTDSFGLMVTFGAIRLTVGEDETIEIAVDEPLNHGKYVSAIAHAAPKGKLHGSVVGTLAKSDLGKKSFVPSDGAAAVGAKAAKVGKAEKVKPATSKAVPKQKPAKKPAKSSASKGKKK